MPVYRAMPAPRAGLIEDPEFGVAATAEVIVFPEQEGRDTGLLDAQGNRLFRYRDPVGFRIR
jgi:hypothetical protein